MQQHLSSHFSMAGHDGFLNDVSITFIDKTDSSDPLRREDYWRQTLITMVPYGVNNKDSVWWVSLYGNISFFWQSILSLVLLFLYYHCCCYFYCHYYDLHWYYYCYYYHCTRIVYFFTLTLVLLLLLVSIS